MNKFLTPVSKEHFEKKVKIRFNNISDGFNNYNNKTIEGNEEEFISFIEQAFEINGEENSYVDFYYNLLQEEDKKRLKDLITEEDREILKDFEEGYKEKNIYFRLTKESMELLIEELVDAVESTDERDEQFSAVKVILESNGIVEIED